MEYLGNKSLLKQSKHGFLCSRCTRSSVILPCLDWAVEQSHGATPIMSTFHSEMEEAVLDILLKGTCPLILVLGRRLYKTLPEKLREPLGSGRLLIISVSNQPRINQKSSLLCNQYICRNVSSLTFGFLSETSSLYPLYEEAIKNIGKVEVIER